MLENDFGIFGGPVFNWKGPYFSTRIGRFLQWKMGLYL